MRSTFVRHALCCALLAGFGMQVAAQNIAVVNGKPIPKTRADNMINELKKAGQQDGRELQQAVREELINREILVQEAMKRGIAGRADVQTQLELARQSILIRALVQDEMQKNPVSDAEIEAEYNRIKGEMGGKEYKARHILVDSEESAKEIIAALKRGAKFEEQAKKSKDTGSAQNGGDLGYQSPGVYVKSFADALVKLEKGKMTDTPVQSQFGWHVIQLDDIRESQIPALAEVKGQLSERLKQSKLDKFRETLKDKAKVQ
ncbi:peptidylprolyl isomerase [Parvibium lacunae]|uniref:peptidylprolyl isomerase n=1 Tax=Parvibium lacunae TaxID=1888893 RepID=A0A368L7V8_9BURK|nr:peptidylprolyl isomerase [Parvibium lacunae]RCS59642.1 peptidylprolyl isomerase [Parvibium lacunae]